MKDYLIVYGHNVRRGGSCYKETEIDCNELVKYMPIIKKIHDTLNKTENWSGGITLERTNDGTYIEHVFQYNEDVELIVLKDILYNSYGPLEYTFYTFDENGVHFAEKVSAQAMNSEIEKRYTKVYK